MSAKFPRGGGGAGPFLARSLVVNVVYMTFSIDEDYMCSGILMEPTGMIESPDRNGDGVYDLFLDCVWIIIAPKGKGIQMEFPSFSLEQSFKCTYDKVIVSTCNLPFTLSRRL